MIEFWNDTAVPALLSVLTVALTVGTAYAISAIRRWGERQKIEWARTVIEAATDAVERAVQAVNQTFVDDLRSLNEDGQLDKNSAKEALGRAINLAKQQLGAEGVAALGKVLGGATRVEQALQTMVESSVAEIKQEALTTEAKLDALVALADNHASEKGLKP